MILSRADEKDDFQNQWHFFSEKKNTRLFEIPVKSVIPHFMDKSYDFTFFLPKITHSVQTKLQSS